MEITETLYVKTRAEWRQWLATHHATKREIWLVYYKQSSGKPRIAYNDAVEVALCFGWIDSTQKSLDAERSAQKFSPRKPKSNWSELNKERARQLVANGDMTDAGRVLLPDLSTESFVIPADILAALKADKEAWTHFQQFSVRYTRIRIGYIEEVRKQPEVFSKRLAHFVKMTAQNKTYGTIR